MASQLRNVCLAFCLCLLLMPLRGSHADRPDALTPDGGTWHNGVLDDKEAEERTKRNVEEALYLQRPLLDKALAGLQPRDKSRINMYLLAVAGDGAQEVFRREVEFVRKQFDRSFGTAGRSVALVNSRTTVTSIPMATQTSLRETLQAIAAKMDKDNDVLFLFLTSHGSKHHALALNQNGMDLRDLPAGELASLLKGSGIRWKVVVVSACYAGGFIDPLKDQNTMVIAAARRDRTSFGCADDNDFTYFGRAFFKEALPRTRDFGRAFEEAKVLIDQWEKRELAADPERTDKEEGHSLPQIWQPVPIKAQLDRWRAQLNRAG
jgi:hypothetical protein